MALIENIQREDLNAIEIALTFYRLIKDYNLTQERLSERVGKNATISNYVRSLQLPAEIQMGLKDRKIDMGHARAILGLENAADQLKIYNLILKNGYSVRTVEKMVKSFMETGNFQPKEKPKKSNKLNELKEIGELKSHLSKIFSVKVQLTCDEKER